jgi:hypothetical protein
VAFGRLGSRHELTYSGIAICTDGQRHRPRLFPVWEEKRSEIIRHRGATFWTTLGWHSTLCIQPRRDDLLGCSINPCFLGHSPPLRLALKHREGSQRVLDLLSFGVMIAVVFKIVQPPGNRLPCRINPFWHFVTVHLQYCPQIQLIPFSGFH